MKPTHRVAVRTAVTASDRSALSFPVFPVAARTSEPRSRAKLWAISHPAAASPMPQRGSAVTSAGAGTGAAMAGRAYLGRSDGPRSGPPGSGGERFRHLAQVDELPAPGRDGAPGVAIAQVVGHRVALGVERLEPH